MHYLGELISIGVAVSWTMSALFFEYAGKRIGSLIVNILRLIFAIVLMGAFLTVVAGSPLPQQADGATWFWMVLSGLVGFVFGDLCLFHSYLLITARFSQLLMTLAPPFAALFGWILLGEKLSPTGFLGMAVTLTGIAISVLKRRDAIVAGGSNLVVVSERDKGMPAEKTNGIPKSRLRLNISAKGLTLGICGALGQGLGIVLSKQGMNHYSLSAQDPDIVKYIPFAATQIRIITGVIGFALIIILSGRTRNFVSGVKDRKGAMTTFAGSIFGPFVGVSLSLMAVQYTNTAIASTIMATTPIIILIPYILIYKRKVTPVEFLGALLSVAGVSLFFM
jgi:drug/metabolite transporter (DMT)-like permease